MPGRAAGAALAFAPACDIRVMAQSAIELLPVLTGHRR
ncbi:hypothetical protein [Bradyrhizobium brasilense]